MRRICLLLIFLCLVFCGCSSSSDDTIITYEKAKELVEDGALIIDVRSYEEYEAGHIDGAILMSVDTINEDVASKSIDSKDNRIIVYCRSGNRSSQAVKMLKDLGYENVYDLGSIDNWKE